VQATFQMTFSTAFAGAHRITAEAWTSGAVDSGTVPLGTWTVPASPGARAQPLRRQPGWQHRRLRRATRHRRRSGRISAGVPPEPNGTVERNRRSDRRERRPGMGCWAAQ
jgi:hypothetical protein